MGLSEIRWTQGGELNGGELIWSRNEYEHKEGVGFLLHNSAKQALLGYKPINSRPVVARFAGRPFNISVIQIYAPTADSTEEQIETFYCELEEAMKEISKKRMW